MLLVSISILFVCFIYALGSGKKEISIRSLKKRYYYILKATYCFPIFDGDVFRPTTKSGTRLRGACSVPRFLLGLYIAIFSLPYALLYRSCIHLFEPLFNRYIHVHVNINLFFFIANASSLNRLTAFLVSITVFTFLTRYLYEFLYVASVRFFKDKISRQIDSLNLKDKASLRTVDRRSYRRKLRNISVYDVGILGLYSVYIVYQNSYIVPPYWFWFCVLLYMEIADSFKTNKDFIINF